MRSWEILCAVAGIWWNIFRSPPCLLGEVGGKVGRHGYRVHSTRNMLREWILEIQLEMADPGYPQTLEGLINPSMESWKMLELPHVYSWMPTVCISSQLCAQWHNASSSKLAMVGLFISWKLANTTIKAFKTESWWLYMYQHTRAAGTTLLIPKPSDCIKLVLFINCQFLKEIAGASG